MSFLPSLAALVSLALLGPPVKLSNATLMNQGAVVADINGDGFQDLVVASFGDDRVSWFAGDGNGNLGPQNVLTDDADGAIRVLAFDFDLDGDTDVVAASYMENSVSTFENLGTNASGTTFGARVVLTTFVNGVVDLHAADLTGDGYLDLITASENDNRIAWFRNLTNGGFANLKVLVGNSNGARGVHAGDLDGDGDLDVVAAAHQDSTVAWFENLGGNAFSSEKILYAPFGGVSDVVAADFDGDGLVDVAACGGDVWLLTNTGAAQFAPVVQVSSFSTRHLYANDIDLDGDPDLLATAAFSSYVLAIENLGASFDQAQTTLFQSQTISDLGIGDFDGDGAPELISVAKQEDTPRYFRNDGLATGSFASFSLEPSKILGNNAAAWVSAADLDADGIQDLVVASPQEGLLSWAPGLGAGEFGPQVLISNDESGIRRTAVHDFDGDGHQDVIALKTDGGRLTLYRGKGNGLFEPANVIAQKSSFYDMDVGDIDGDGDLDLVASRRYADLVELYRNKGSQGFAYAGVVSSTILDPGVVRVADLDGDGLADVTVSGVVVAGVTWFRNLGGGLLAPGVLIGPQVYGVVGIAVGDLDNDGDMDLVIAGKTFGDIWRIRNLAPGQFSTPQIVITGTFNAVDLVLGDLDSDGNLDVVVGYDFTRQVLSYPGNGNGTFGPLDPVATDVGIVSSVLVEDLDGDGDLDVALTSASDDMLYWVQNQAPLIDCNDNGVLDSADLAAGTSTDLDGDGQLDDCVAPPLFADVLVVPATGGTQEMWLDAGATYAGEVFFILGTLSGTAPGFDLGVGILPLNQDAYFDLTLFSPAAAPVSHTFGALGTGATAGLGTATLTVPGGYAAALLGATAHHAYVLLGPTGVTFVSNALPLTFQ